MDNEPYEQILKLRQLVADACVEASAATGMSEELWKQKNLFYCETGSISVCFLSLSVAEMTILQLLIVESGILR